MTPAGPGGDRVRFPFGLLGISWGRAAVGALCLQALTGIMLGLNYQPGFPSSYDSTLVIQQRVPMGWLIRGVHLYGSYVLVGLVFAHMAAIFHQRQFRPAPARGWVLGLGLSGVVALSIFSGRVLPMDMTGALATRVALSVAAAVPMVGLPTARLLFGYDGYGEFSPHRFHLLHVSLLPLISLAGLAWHLGGGFQRLRPRDARLAGLILVIGLMLLAAAGIFPADLPEKFDPLKEVRATIHPVFVFMGVYLLAGKVSSPWQLLLGLAPLLLAWALVPWIDLRLKSRRQQQWFQWVAAAAMAAAVLLTILAYPLID